MHLMTASRAWEVACSSVSTAEISVGRNAHTTVLSSVLKFFAFSFTKLSQPRRGRYRCVITFFPVTALCAAVIATGFLDFSISGTRGFSVFGMQSTTVANRLYSW